MNLEITEARKEDLAEILALQKLCFMENARRYNKYDLSPLTETQAEIEEVFSSRRFLKAVENGRIIGSLRAFEKDGTCYIARVIVHPDFQNKGIGTRLMHEAEARYPAARRFELFTGVTDYKNQHLYTKLGYVKFKEEAHGSDPHMIFMEKPGAAKREE
jgi:ribosomal protein S18 acetylase RimI-like enzyme